jgi:hypothetical protein
MTSPDTEPTTDQSPRRSVAILILGLLLVVPLNFLARALTDDGPDEIAGALLEPPQDEGIWIVGNSIFKTGVDPVALSGLLGSEPVDFEYHGGHYTSLWYLIAENALPTVAEKPSLLVWGFRPAYAALPAFRQNSVNDTELFLVDGDPVYEALAQGIDPVSQTPLDEVAVKLDEAVGRTGLYGYRAQGSAHLNNFGLDLGVAIADQLGASGADIVRREVLEGDAPLLDVLNNVVTGGAVQLAEERVVDGVGDFVTGDQATYDDSFVPITADRIAEQGVDQLVIIWPPRIVAESNPDPIQDQFVVDAVADLEARGITVLNLYNDPTIEIGYYASGDHFNPEGRDLVTARLADLLRSLGYG